MKNGMSTPGQIGGGGHGMHGGGGPMRIMSANGSGGGVGQVSATLKRTLSVSLAVQVVLSGFRSYMRSSTGTVYEPLPKMPSGTSSDSGWHAPVTPHARSSRDNTTWV